MSFKMVGSWALAFVVSSLLFDWYSVAAVGGVCGWFLVGRKPFLTAACAAATASWALFLVTAMRGPVGTLAGLLEEIMGISTIALYLAVGLFPALLAGSAALCSGALREGLND